MMARGLAAAALKTGNTKLAAWVLDNSRDPHARALAAKALAVKPYRLVANSGMIPDGTTSSGGYTRGEQRAVTSTRNAAKNVKLVHLNWYVDGAGVEQNAPNAITLESGLEYSSAFHRANYGGSTTILANPGDTVVSDVIGDIPANADLFVRQGQVVTSGQVWMTGLSSGNLTATRYYKSTSATSQVAGTGTMSAPSGGTTGDGFLFTGIIGQTDTPQPSVTILGDSWGRGINDGGDAQGNFGYVPRGLWADRIPSMRVSRSSDRATWFMAGHAKRQTLLQYTTNTIVEYGYNDIAGGRTLAQLQADLQAIWSLCRSYGHKVFQAKYGPRTTSTDNWTTAANQTPVAGFEVGGVRDQMNTWFDGQVTAGNIDGTIDPNPYFEDQSNHGKWVTDGVTAKLNTNDGLHPNNAISTSAAAAVSPIMSLLKAG